jgi:hypothetical protein
VPAHAGWWPDFPYPEISMIRRLSLLLLFSFFLAPFAVAQHHDHGDQSAGRPPDKLGTVNFPNSCDKAVHASIQRGVALLHSFWFEEGLRTFQGVLKADPACAIAYWGIAVNRMLNPFGGEPSPKLLAEGLAAVEKGLEIGPKTQRERDYLEAVAHVYRNASTVRWNQRLLAYEKAMEQVVARYPEDYEAVVFYAVALNIAHDNSDQTYAKPLKAARLLEPLMPKFPDHPGVSHFLIHSYDFPPLADKGLAAARRYADIAPSAAHALHMPSHIFTRVGAWEDSAATNRRSETAARSGGGGVDEALHAIDYQVYAYLQLAQDGAARQAMERAMADGPKASTRPAGPFALAAAPARYALERGDWSAASKLPVHESPVLQARAITHFARAIGAARSGNPAAAKDDLAQLGALRDQLAERKIQYWADQVEIQRLASAGWVKFAEGGKDEGLTLMRQAADLESRTEKSPISPGPILPARELLGDMLLEMGQSAAALKEYEASQQREPNRFRGYYGVAIAAARAGNIAKAKQNLARLSAISAKGDPRPELKQVRDLVARN